MNIGVLPQDVTLTREWKTTWVTGLKTGGWRIGEGCWSKENSKKMRIRHLEWKKRRLIVLVWAQSVVTNYTYVSVNSMY